ASSSALFPYTTLFRSAFLGPVPQDQPNIIGHVLFKEKFYALVPSTHRLANKQAIDLIELKDEPFVLFPEGYILHKLVFDGCSQRSEEHTSELQSRENL